MLKFIVFALLAISHSGDARILSKPWSQRLSQHVNDGSFKADYEKAVTEYAELKYPETRDADFFKNYNKDDIYITVYSKARPHGHKIDVDHVETLKNSSYDVKKLTKIFVGPVSHSHNFSAKMVTAYLRHHNENVNVITISYEKFFGIEFTRYVQIYDYLTETIAKLVEHVHHYGTLMDNVHVIGFGMSAHVVAGAAKMLHPYKIGRITGLDPTGGMFDQNQWLGELMADDADFVDVIYTNMRKYGTKKERGSVNFYPNGGEIQPQSDDFLSHQKALAYFVESIVSTRTFQSEDANSWSDYQAGHTSGHTAYMGEYVSKRARNKFYLHVNPTSPYSKAGTYDLMHKDQVTNPQSQMFKTAKVALMKQTIPFEETLSREVAAYNAEDARTEKTPTRRVHDYVRRASWKQSDTVEYK